MPTGTLRVIAIFSLTLAILAACSPFRKQGVVVNLNGMVIYNKVMIHDFKYLLQLPQSC